VAGRGLYGFYRSDSCRLQRNPVNGLALRLIGHRGIDLRGRNILMAEDMLDGIDTGACLNLQRAECVAAAVVAQVLGYACRLQPVLQRALRQAVVEAGEDLVRGLAAIYYSLQQI